LDLRLTFRKICPDYSQWNIPTTLLQSSPLSREDTANFVQDLDIFNLSKFYYTTNPDQFGYTSSPVKKSMELSLDWPDLCESNPWIPVQAPKNQDFLEVAPVLYLPDFETSANVRSIRRAHRKKNALGPRKEKAGEEDMFLCQLRDVKGLSWKEVAIEFRRKTGQLIRVPALQMRVSRFRKRKPGISTKLTQFVWKPSKFKNVCYFQPVYGIFH
jgi:hypothetical protein